MVCEKGETPKLTLEQRAEQRRQEKLLKKEIQKLATKEVGRRQAKKRAAKIKALVPEIPADGPVIDPVVQELARRELARRKLIEFVQQFHPSYKAGWVHHDICRRLEQFSLDVAAGKSPRLMILMPPRHGKSQLASKLYPAWHLGHYPNHEFIGCSYNVALAMDFSREAREVIKSQQYGLLFPGTRLNPDFAGAEAWRLASSTGVGAGGYNAAGVTGGITGKGAHILVIDDPVKNNEEAENPDQRKKVWDWYRSTAYTRLAPGGGVLVIQTWWHDDDLAGRLQREMMEDPEADQFIVVKYPAIAEEDEEYRAKGEALHPARYDLAALEKIKQALGPNYWSALYQQAPISEEGAYFTAGMFQHAQEPPRVQDLYIYQAWDFAMTEEELARGDYTVGVCFGVDYDDNIHVLEVDRFKSNDAGVVEDHILDMYARYPYIAGFGVEDGAIWRTLKKGLMKRSLERKIYLNLDQKENVLKPVKSKMVRARPLQARMQNRKVFFPRGVAWYDDVVKELTRFPAGKNDDIVDAMAWGVQLLVGKPAPAKPNYMTPKKELTVAQKVARAARFGGGGLVGECSHMSA